MMKPSDTIKNNQPPKLTCIAKGYFFNFTCTNNNLQKIYQFKICTGILGPPRALICILMAGSASEFT